MSLSIGKHQVSFDDAHQIHEEAEVFLDIDEHGLLDQNDPVYYTRRHYFFINVPGQGRTEVLFRGDVPDATPFFAPREPQLHAEYDPFEDLAMQ